MLGAGQRHVREPQVLAALLGRRAGPCGGCSRGPASADVDRAREARVGVVEDDRDRLLVDPGRLPQVRARRRPGTPAPCCGGSSGPGRPRRRTPAAAGAPRRPPARPPRRAGAATPPARTCRAARPPRRRAAAGRRGAGRSAAARRRPPPARAPGSRSTSVIVSDSDASAAPPQHRGPRVQAPVHLLPLLVVGRRRPARASSPGTTSSSRRARARATPAAPAPPAAAATRAPRGVANTLPAPLMTAGIASASSASRTSSAWLVGAHQHRDVAGPTPGASPAAPTEIVGDVARDVAPRAELSLALALLASARRVGAVARPAPAAARRRCAGSRLAVRRRAHLPVDDPLVAELGAAEHRVVGVDQPLVAAPVDLERGPCARRLGRRPGTSRRRRRGRRRSPASGRRSAPACVCRRRTRAAGSPTGSGRCPGTRRPAPRGSARAAARRPRPRRLAQRVAQPRQQVVVGDHRQRALARVELVAHARRPAARAAPGAPSPDVSRGSIGAPGFSTVSRAIRSASARLIRGASASHVAAHVEVVDDLAEQVADVLDQLASGSRSPATPSPPSTSWQNPWVVAIVAASKSASARTSRSRRRSRPRAAPSASSRDDVVIRRPAPASTARARARRSPAARARGRAARPSPCA